MYTHNPFTIVNLALREFRARLYRCLTARADALFELCDAILCSDHAVTSLVQLSLVPAFRRGHGALYDALAAGQVDEEALAGLLTGTLPQLIDGQEGLAWVSGHDVFYASPVTWPGKHGRPGKHGTRVACHKADDPDQSNPEPDESLTLPGTPLYGTVRVSAWHGVHPLIHGDRGWFAGWDGDLPVLPGTVLRVTVQHLPDGRACC
jgi:hypothetical protein